jgi:carbon-monoxide dehydrogenase medium subunit
MRKGLLRPSHLVDIKSIPQICDLSVGPEEELIIGAGVTLEQLKDWARREKVWSGLFAASGSIGSGQVRNRATVVGNVCRASPAGDMTPMLIALDGKVQIQGPTGRRRVAIEEFITGPGQIGLAQGEMVESLRIPRHRIPTATAYLKLGARRAMDTAIASVAVGISFDEPSGKITSIRIVLGAVGPKPLRAREAEEMLMRHGLTPAVLEKAAHLAQDAAMPITDLRATADYRSRMTKVLTKRAIEQAWREGIEGGRG